MRTAIILGLFVFINAAIYVIFYINAPNALVTVGNPADLQIFKSKEVLSDPKFVDRTFDISQYSFKNDSVFFSLLGVQATVLVAFLIPGGRWVLPSNFNVAARKTSNILCIGLGGVGKTTLIKSNLLDNPHSPLKTEKFETYSTTRHINNVLTDIKIHDHEGQDFETLNSDVHEIERSGQNIDHIIVVVSIFPTSKVGSEWILEIPENLGDVANAEIIKDQLARLSLIGIGGFVLNMPELNRISVIFNQVDEFRNKDMPPLSFDFEWIQKVYAECFDPLKTQIEEIRGRYELRYNSQKEKPSSFLGRGNSDKRLRVDYHIASIKWGVELDVEAGVVKPLTHSLLSK